MRNDLVISTESFVGRLPSFDAFYARNEGRLVDIFGPVIDEVMPHVGWAFTAGGAQISLHRGETYIGFGWALPTVDKANRTRINLTYAIDEAETGKGLATMLACAAFQQAFAQGIAAEEVSAQILVSNLTSQRAALSLGLNPDPELAFSCVTSSGERSYVGFSCGYEVFAEMAAERMAKFTEAPKRERYVA